MAFWLFRSATRGGNAWNAGNILDVPLDRTAEALSALHALPISGKVGLYGVSRGAEHALLVTSLMARDEVPELPDAVAVHAPSDVICGAFIGANWRDTGDPGWQAWDPALRAWTWKGASDALLPTMPIEIERYVGPLLLTHGANDTMWSADMTRRLAARLRLHGRTPEVHILPGQDHAPMGDGEKCLSPLPDRFSPSSADGRLTEPLRGHCPKCRENYRFPDMRYDRTNVREGWISGVSFPAIILKSRHRSCAVQGRAIVRNAWCYRGRPGPEPGPDHTDRFFQPGQP